MFALQNAKTRAYGMGKERPGSVQTASSMLLRCDISHKLTERRKFKLEE